MAEESFWRYPSADASRSFFDDSRPRSFVQHVCSRNFHQKIFCPRTGSPVTFAVCGDLESEHVILYCLPSGCSRYLGVFMHGICALVGVKLIAIDRPGSGGTALCPPQERIQVSLQQTISVLYSLRLLDHNSRPTSHRPITLLAHSAGIFYALALIQHFTQTRSALHSSTSRIESPFGRRPRLLLSSPWVPTSVSKSSLALLPRSVIRMNTNVMPGLTKAFGALGASFGAVTKSGKGCLGWSAGVVRPTASGPSSPRDGLHARDSHQDNGRLSPYSALEVGGRTSPRPSSEVVTRASSVEVSGMTTPLLLSGQEEQYNPFLSVIGLDPPPSPTDEKQKRLRETSTRKYPDATFHPPHELHYRYSMCLRIFPDRSDTHPATGKPLRLEDPASGPQLLSDMMAAEGFKGITEDFLLSLGHAPGLPSSTLEELIKQGIEACSKSRKGAEITVVWAAGDKLVPSKGRAWLDELIRQAVASSPLDSKGRKRLRYDRLEMVDAGHDAPMGSEAVMIELLRRAKHGAAASAVPPSSFWSSAPRSTLGAAGDQRLSRQFDGPLSPQLRSGIRAQTLAHPVTPQLDMRSRRADLALQQRKARRRQTVSDPMLTFDLSKSVIPTLHCDDEAQTTEVCKAFNVNGDVGDVLPRRSFSSLRSFCYQERPVLPSSHRDDEVQTAEICTSFNSDRDDDILPRRSFASHHAFRYQHSSPDPSASLVSALSLTPVLDHGRKKSRRDSNRSQFYGGPHSASLSSLHGETASVSSSRSSNSFVDRLWSRVRPH